MSTDLNLYTQLHTNVGAPATQTEQESDPSILLLKGVSKRFNDIYALRNISLNISRGEVFGLLGTTGAGKTTLLKMVMGFLLPDEGEIQVFGSTEAQAVRARTGYLPEHPYFHPNFTGLEYLQAHGRLAGFTGGSARKAASRLVDMVGLGPVAKRRIKYYSLDALRRLGLAVALVGAPSGYPELLVLDEPSVQLDRTRQLAIRDIILDCKRNGSTILMASHKITEVERACTWVGILRNGRLMAQTNVENNPRTIVVAVPRDGAIGALPRLTTHIKNLHPFVTVTGGQTETAPLLVSLPAGAKIRNAAGIKAATLRALVDNSWDIISVYMERKDLESIYMQTLPPAPQDGKEAEAQLAAPLGARTGGLATGPLGPSTRELPQYPEGRNTRPLRGLDVGDVRPAEVNPNGHEAHTHNEPAVRGEEQELVRD
jgi:ABC-type multidrug transport system ATPase subunit